jgi:hypothetical protein
VSRYNTLYLGEPLAVAEELENSGFDDREIDNHDVNYLRLALINAHKRIAALQEAVATLSRSDALHHGRYG